MEGRRERGEAQAFSTPLQPFPECGPESCKLQFPIEARGIWSDLVFITRDLQTEGSRSLRDF